MAAQAHLDAAQAQLGQLTEGARPDATAAAKAELAAAQAARQQLFSGLRLEDEITAAAALSNAEAALHQAQAAYDRAASRNDIGMPPESLQVQQATNNYKAAQARYQELHAGPNSDVVAAARARVQQAQAALDRLVNPATKSQIAGAEAQVRSAQAELDLLRAGARVETLVAAAADVAQAEAAPKRQPGRKSRPSTGPHGHLAKTLSLQGVKRDGRPDPDRPDDRVVVDHARCDLGHQHRDGQDDRGQAPRRGNHHEHRSGASALAPAIR